MAIMSRNVTAIDVWIPIDTRILVNQAPRHQKVVDGLLIHILKNQSCLTRIGKAKPMCVETQLR